MASSQLDIQGTCTISQGDFRLSEFNEHAVTTIAGGENVHWRITYHPTAPESRQITIAIKHGRLGENKDVEHVLTVGEKTEGEGIQVFVRPLESPPPKCQLWTLEHVGSMERLPPILRAHIQSVQYPELSAGTGILPYPLPRIFENVAVGKLGSENERWTIDYLVL